MTRLAVLWLAPISIACSKGPAPPSGVTGTLTVDGKPVTVTACRPGHAEHTFVELTTPSGVLRFEDTQLYWNHDPQAPSRGDKLTCRKLDRSWGGGTRDDGTSYWRGILRFECSGPPQGGALAQGGFGPQDADRNRSAGSGPPQGGPLAQGGFGPQDADRNRSAGSGPAVAGDLTLECGDIGPQDRKELDQMRDQMREDQRKSLGSAGSGG